MKLLRPTISQVLGYVINILEICIDLDEEIEMKLTHQKDNQIREGIWPCARVVATRSRSKAQH